MAAKKPIKRLSLDICDKDLDGEEITWTFCDQKLQKTNQSKLRIKKSDKEKRW